jgi:ATP-dependent DNA helicase RecG
MVDGVDILSLQERVRATLSMSESHFREFKSALEGAPGAKVPRDPKTIKRDIGETLVAFANADGGDLLVGVEDDGTVTGVPHDPDVVQSLLDAWRTHVHGRTPLDRPLALQLQIDGLKVLFFSVEKGTSVVHLTQDGRCLQRKDRESVPVPSEMINFERQERLSREYDRGFVDGADATALHEEALTAAGSLVAPGLSPEKLLQLLGLAEYGSASLRLRRAALLLFAKDISLWHPRCEVRVLRVSGTELRAGREYNVIDDKHVVGNVATLLQSAWDELRPYLIETRLGPDGRFQEQVRYPEDACREALTNAIAHRDYTIEGRAIEVYVFDDRLEVRSPGALLSTVTVEGLRSLAGIHQSRNTAIARTLRELGYMREMGEGFRRMFQLMRAHELVEPEVVADSQQFTVSLRHRSVFSEEDQRWISAFEEFHLAKDEEKVLLLGRSGQSLSVQQIMDAVDIVDTEDYRALIERLLNKGLIRGLRTTKSTGKQRRNSPRWAVIPPDQALKHLREVQAQLRRSVPGGSLKSADFERIATELQPESPYGRSGGTLKRSIIALGLIDSTGLALGATGASVGTVLGGAQPDVLVVGHPTSSRASSVSPEEMMDARAIAESRGSRLYIGNLAFDATAQDVRAVATEIGEVADVAVPRDFSGRSRNRGYAFVQYRDAATATLALERLAGRTILGRPVTVDWASSGGS